MKNTFIKVCAATPRVRIADPMHNAAELARMSGDADAAGARVIVFPELCLTGATCGDLFKSEMLLTGAKEALREFLMATKDLAILSVVGLPLESEDGVYNAAVTCQYGKVLAMSVKALTAEERRWFTDVPVACIDFDGEQIPVSDSTRIDGAGITLGVSVGGTKGADAALVCVPTCEAETVGAAARRSEALTALSKETGAAYIASYAGIGESTTDCVFGGQKLIAASGTLLGVTVPFSDTSLLIAEVDTAHLSCNPVEKARTPASEKKPSLESVDPHPFFPTDPAALKAHCEEILAIQSWGLAMRIERAWAKKIVVGISGGLDSTLALLVMVRAMDLLKRPRTDIIALTMPCFGTTVRTKTNATVLCEELGVDFRCVDIFDAVNQHFKDIGHDPAVRDVTYENAQARERTQVLMDVANDCGGMVIGTGDLSELALGWATYNGDHMSMYGVNANLPKTLIRHVVAHCAEDNKAKGQAKIADALFDILDTPVSPELLPADTDGKIAQKTEDLVGPYELHDFYLYYTLRYGLSPKSLYAMAQKALGGTYDDETLKKWLRTFVRRFFSQQFKRSCLPDGPQVFPIGLSPRGAWVMPSDASSALWLSEIDAL